MGAGDFGAGEGPAGEDPVVAPPVPRDSTPIVAIYFDGATRTFPYDSAGKLQSIDPVDQKVALAVLLELGKLGPAPDVGSTVRQTPIRDLPRMQADADRRIRKALKTMLDAKDIAIDSIAVSAGPRWRERVTFRYFNLRLDQSLRRTITTG